MLAMVSEGLVWQSLVFRRVSTNLRDVLGMRCRGVGGDSTTGERSKGLAAHGRDLASRCTEEHCAVDPIDDGRDAE